jgi:hypothetical protein
MVKDFIRSFFTTGIACVILFTGCSSGVSQSQTYLPDSIDYLSPTEIEVYQTLPIVASDQRKREKLQDVYMSQVGVREATGKNDGKHVRKYLAAVNLSEGFAWCAAFVRWCFDQVGIKTSITAWSPTAHNASYVIYERGKWKRDMHSGDVFTLYYPKKKRIGHTGFVNRMTNSNTVETVEGNTNGEGSREGDGVYIKYRPIKTIHSITSWLQ